MADVFQYDEAKATLKEIVSIGDEVATMTDKFAQVIEDACEKTGETSYVRVLRKHVASLKKVLKEDLQAKLSGDSDSIYSVGNKIIEAQWKTATEGSYED